MLTNVELPIEQIASLVANQLSIIGDPNVVSKKELEAEVLLILQSKFDLIQKQINLLSKTKNVSEVNDLHLDGDGIELVLSNGTTYTIKLSEIINTITDYMKEGSINKWSPAIIYDKSGLTQEQLNQGLESINDLITIQQPYDGQRVYVKGYHKPSLFVELNLYKGGGLFIYDATVSRAKHDGGSLLTKDVLTAGSSDNLFSFNITFIDNV